MLFRFEIYIIFFFLFLIVFLSVRYYLLGKKNQVIIRQRDTLIKELKINQQNFRDLNHKTKNCLQLVISILNMQVSDAQNPEVESSLKKSKKRINTVLLLHDKIQFNNLKKIDFDQYLTNLKEILFQTFEINDNQIKFLHESNGLSLDLDSVLVLGLIVNELLCNSILHAFSEEIKNPEINFLLERRGKSGKYFFLYADNGIGFSKSKVGLGLKMIDVLVIQLRGDIRYNVESKGFSCQIIF